MANYTLTITTNESAYISQTHPDTNYWNAEYMPSSFYDNTALLRVPQLAQYHKKALLSFQISGYGRYSISDATASVEFSIGDIVKDIDFQKVTYYTLPYFNRWFLARTGSFGVNNDWVSTGVESRRSELEYIMRVLKGELLLAKIEIGGFASETAGRFYLTGSSFNPYITLVFSDYNPTTERHSPSSGFINEKLDNKFSWTISQPVSYESINQSSALFSWRVVGSDTVHDISVLGSDMFVTVPANTFPEGEIEWRVKVTSDDNMEGPFSEWMKLTTVDATPTCKNLSPNNTYLNGAVKNRLEWDYSIDTGSNPTGFEVQYMSESGWVGLGSEENNNTYYDIPPYTLPAGQISWRVRAKNSDGVWSEWSDPALIIVQSPPMAPTISNITNTARPVVSWQASGQQSYILEVFSGYACVYSSGEIATDAKKHRITDYLDCGDYNARLRVKNVFGLLSEAGTLQFTLSYGRPTMPVLQSRAVQNGVQLTIANYSLFSKVYILRDGIPIHKMTSNVWTDYTALGTHQYVARGVNASDCYTDSPPVLGESTVDICQIACVESPGEPVYLKYRRGSRPTIAGELALEGTGVYLAGRTYPIYEFSEHRSEGYTLTYTCRKTDDFDALRELAFKGALMLYRDMLGNRFYCVITGLSPTQDGIGTDFSLSVVRVDCVERIDYDLPGV